MLPAHPSEFKSAGFWDEFFLARGPDKAFEWYCGSNELLPILDRELAATPKGADRSTCLHLGCGNSTLSRDLATRRIASLNVDFSPPALRALAKQACKPHSADGGAGTGAEEFLLGDALRLPLRRGARFGFAIDKGLLDAMIDADDEEAHARATAVLGECARVLEAGAPLLVVTLAQAHICAVFRSALFPRGAPAAAAPSALAPTAAMPVPMLSLWSSLTVRPLQPQSTASALQPFVLVLRRAQAPAAAAAAAPVPPPPCLLFDSEAVSGWDELLSCVTTSRESFAAAAAAAAAAEAAAAAAAVAAAPPPGPTHWLFQVDLKPEDTEVDLAALSAKAALVGAGAVEWLSTATLPVGYGLSKLRLKGILPMCGATGGQIEEVQDVCDMLAELDGAMSADMLDLQPCCPR